MSSPADIRDGLAAALTTISGLSVYPYDAERVTSPAAVVSAAQGRWIDMERTAAAVAANRRMHWTVRVLVGTATSQAGIIQAESLAVAVIAALDADPTLGGAVTLALAVSAGGVYAVTLAQGDYFAVDIEVRTDTP